MRFNARIIILAILIVFSLTTAFSQTTEFTYQGSLKDGANAANGNYDFEFALFDSLAAGTQIGSTLSRNAVVVSNGSFAVKLDFGSQFPGANRFLEIRVRLSSGGAFTPLVPRSPVNSSPYAVKSITADDATQLGGIAANQYVTTASGGTNFIQNTTSPQASSNFNISGNGTAGGTLSGNIVNATAQYNIGGSRILSNAGFQNLFAGVSAGTSNAGIGNSFFGRSAGEGNTTGNSNSFFGRDTGVFNTMGSNNSFVGAVAGILNRTGGSNSFFGTSAGANNTMGNFNSFFGASAGNGNQSGDGNTLIGALADVASIALTNSTAIGSRAFVSQSNSLVLGSINGTNGAAADTNVGIGTAAPAYRLHVVGENIRVEGNTPSIFPRISHNFTGGAVDEKRWQNYASPGGLNFSALNDAENAETRWLRVNRGSGTAISSVAFENGFVAINNLGPAGITQLCRNGSNEISTCSSSLRYKTNIGRFGYGLDIVRRLNPITFDWKDGGMHDLGLGAEDVAAIEQLLVTYNAKGEVEGVKYDRIGVVLVNAVKEQQAQIEAQDAKIKSLEMQVEALKALVCSQNQTADACRPKQ
ncbi:hypothetical protein BH10ACI3_BH10ACI3_10110 [soil metagenome]